MKRMPKTHWFGNLNTHSTGVKPSVKILWRRLGSPRGLCVHCHTLQPTFMLDACSERDLWGKWECADVAACEARIQTRRVIERTVA